MKAYLCCTLPDGKHGLYVAPLWAGIQCAVSRAVLIEQLPSPQIVLFRFLFSKKNREKTGVISKPWKFKNRRHFQTLEI